MSGLASPIHAVRHRLARRRQLRTALRMLSASGVIRAGHVELRYASPITRKGLAPQYAVRTEARPATRTATFPSFRSMKSGLSRVRQWAIGVSPSVPLTGE